MNKLLVGVSLMGFLLYRPYIMQSSSLVYYGDDDNYMAHATSIAYGNFPDYSLEGNITFPPFHAMGCGILAAPFVFAGTLVDRTLGLDVVAARTRRTLHDSFTAFGFVLCTLTFMTLGIYWLHCSASLLFGRRIASVAVMLNVLPSGLLLYAYRRPVFPHAYEFALIALLLYLFLRYTRPPVNLGLKTLIAGAAVAGILCVTRLNDGPIGVAFLLCFICQYSAPRPEDGRSAPRKRLLLGLTTVTVVFSAIVSLTAWARTQVTDEKEEVTRISASFYTDFASGRFGTYKGVVFYFESFLHFLCGLDWGILFSAPLMLMGLFGLLYVPGRRYLLIAACALAVNFYIAIVFGSQGGYYGYRYVVYSSLPLSTVGLACLLSKWGCHKRTTLLLALISIVPLMSTLAFEGNPTELTLHKGRTRWTTDWINNEYQFEVWSMILTRPAEMAVAVLKGGPLYAIYLTAVAFGRHDILPEIVKLKYPLFSFTVLLKTLVIWLWPPAVLAGPNLIRKILQREEPPS